MTQVQIANLKDYLNKLEKRAKADVAWRGSPVTSMTEDWAIQGQGHAALKIVTDIKSLLGIR